MSQRNKMHVSRFQLKLTLIFLLVLFIPAILATLFTRYVLTAVRTGMDVDQKVESVLQDTSGIAYDIIEKAEAECQSIAETISAHKEIVSAFDSKAKLKKLVAEAAPFGDRLSTTVFDFRNNNVIKDAVLFSTSTDTPGAIRELPLPDTITSKLKQQNAPFSGQEGEKVYGVAPVFNDHRLIGAVAVYQQLEQGLVRNIIDLQNLLRVYALGEDIENLIWIVVIALIIALAVAGTLLAALLARGVTKRILDLVAGMKEVGKGNLAHRVQVRGKDEIATLIESFNSMTAQLKSSRERLLVTERLAAWRDVARRIAHEIKNPLTPIQLSMYRLRKNLGSERYNQIFDESYASITKEVENLRNMVTEFSQFARMPKPRTSPSSINEVVQDAINLYTGLPDNIVIHTELAENLPQLMADRDQMRQVLHNLIGNAVDAMPDGGDLYVRTLLEAEDVIAVEITDTGCGMSEEVKQKIFTPYFTTKEKGTGLGMAIVAQIVEEHGGEISVDSEQGAGAKVVIKFKSI